MKRFTAFSGGKDSTALALYCPDATPVFTDTGWEPVEVYQQIDRFEQKTGREVVQIRTKKFSSMPDAVRKQKFFPGFRARYCTRIFKIEPYNRFIQDHLPAELLIGLRADEDERPGNLTEMEGLNIRYPFQEDGLVYEDVIRICSENDLLPEYPLYMVRGGCLGCYFKRPAEVQAMALLQPHLLDELQELEESIQDKRDRFAFMFPNLKMSIRDFRRQTDIFNLNPEDVYRDARNEDKKGAACGLFCHK